MWLKGLALPLGLVLAAAAGVCGVSAPPLLSPEQADASSVDAAFAEAGSGAIPAGRTRSQTTGDAQAGAIDAGSPESAGFEPTRNAGSAQDVAGDGKAPWDGAATVRGELLDILNTYEIIAASHGLSDLETTAVATQERIAAASDSDLAVFAEAMPAIERLSRTAAELAAVVVPPAKGVPGATQSSGFPNANYSGLCGSDRNNTEAVFAAQVALQVAKGVWSAASRGCDEVVVIAGEGGNGSLACIVADEILFAAEAVLDDFKFCDDDINGAEIEGSYERLAHVHADVEAIQDRIDEIWEREIEEDIFHKTHLVSLFLPEAHGGRLESVRDIVQKWITNTAAAGMDTTRADCFFQQGLLHMDNNEYRSAFKDFARAYHQLTEDDDSEDDHDRDHACGDDDDDDHGDDADGS